ncbi:hypothetical protein ACFY2Q_08915 [Micromonospora sp. NPDC000316]|uniref:hypothetical protein n=1 Tax=Micromonospora sp. NPDC000316 TaxID=3364216 RepID=UPI0036B7488C
MAGTTLFAIGCLARCLPWWPVTVVGAVVAGVGLPWTLVAAVTAVQTHTPSALLGRVSATANTAMFGPLVAAIPLGSAAVHLGARPPLLAAVAICLSAAAATSDGRARPRHGCPSRSSPGIGRSVRSTPSTSANRDNGGPSP